MMDDQRRGDAEIVEAQEFARADADAHPESNKLTSFMKIWDRGENLISVIRKLPGETILKSGLSAQRRSLIERWDRFDPPSLDGSVPDEEPLLKWIRDGEALIAFVVEFGNDPETFFTSKNNILKDNDALEVIDSANESDSFRGGWRWPWPARDLEHYKKPKWDKGKIIKIGAVASLGLIALVSYFDEED